MRYSKESLIDIGGDVIVEDKTRSNPTYDWIDIVGIPQRPEYLKQSLFFATHSTGEEGWDSGFDRRPYAAQRLKEKGGHLVVDTDIANLDTGYMRATSVDALASKIYDDARRKVKPFVIGVTGSVGKTTTVAFLEHILRTNSQDVTRFYSKRLTPLSVMTHYINRVNQETAFIVMEYSAYFKDHVAKLSNLLPPDISFLLNIYDTHINEGMFANQREIFNSKVQIKPEGRTGFVNQRILSNLSVEAPPDWKPFSVETPEIDNPNFPPTLRTAEMFTAGKLLSKSISMSDEAFNTAYQTFIPKENRIIVSNYYDKKIFFHGETSGGSRLWSWFETVDGSEPWLLVEEINFADEDPQGFISLLEKVFSSDKTFVLDTPTNRQILPVNANYVNSQEFKDILSKKANGYIVYHKALATRSDDFDPETYLVQRW